MFAISLGDDNALLRPLEPWHSEELLANIDRGREWIGRWIRIADVVTDSASAKSFLQSYADKAAADTGRIWGIWLDGVLVGGVLFRVMDVPSGYAEIGCWLEPDATGKGLITRAARVAIDWAIGERGLHRIEWQASSGNAASIAVAKRLGMSLDGVLREHYFFHGRRDDVEVWSVLAHEWEAQPRRS